MLLAIDTSLGTSVAVVDPERGVLAETGTEDTMRHAELVGPAIRDALAEAGVSAAGIGAVAAGMGPGPFTGLRVGIAAAEAFALGIDRPLLPVVSHDAVAFRWYLEGGSGPLRVLTDARRREFAFSRYDGVDAEGLPIRTAEPALVARAELAEVPGTSFEAHAVPAGALGILALRALEAGRELPPAQPLYLRSPDVTISTGKRVSR
ncbi:tRNA (adenosine(37)-N6)-threonylcarbamoyltransferase complex dimerization subunit type 1 TsaB [Agromyces archimandritae]|uniref:tRNA (Adenosine(37)-N6)-threonylcarbamoyltransferase complex dimerization subunit type 1 TsaB n=1 Tax=Agromyces archimandritae TaxID=2781962 RepID=A0A975FNJ4_9MICO|nr:tRNA (adenosine(37)-N6)-threonylcarbamoyltransferase complex dimerization subunit type 1 TsaB [Agromyces archimandritae]QTX05455.1 tRNA (adenosine(37)-N6)-threonylcarbamoyltransferase complex dimerization subunit type 1 TsaB [Agromyces archimandritae]